MRHKFLALTLAVAMLLSLCACGSSHDSASNNTQPSAETPSGGNNDDLVGGDAIDPLTGLPQSEDATEPATQDPISQNPTDVAGQGASQPDTSASNELSGLVLMTIARDNPRMGRWIFTCDISCLDPETGEQTPVSHFLFGDVDTERSYLLPNGVKSLTQDDDVVTRRNWFSSDYQLLAATRVSASDGSYQIGWIKGEKFFNISDKLGLVPESDFEASPRYIAAGFTDDGMYTFYKLSSDALERTYYYVPLDNLSPEQIKEGKIMDEQYLTFEERDDSMTDRISDSLYVMNTTDQISQIYNTETGETAVYVSGDNRFSWNGVVSPDGAEIAFMSRTKTGMDVDIFTMSLFADDTPFTDGAPTKVPVPSSIVLMLQEECKRGAAMNFDTRTMLIDWR